MSHISSKKRKLVGMEVPAEYEQQISAMITDLVLAEEDKKFEVKENVVHSENYDVSAVLDHKVVRGSKWSFLLRFKGYREPEWICDEDCNCEELIREYLSRRKIRVVYIVCRVSTKTQSRYTKVSLDTQEMRLRHVVQTLYGTTDKIRVKVNQIAVSAYKQIPRVLATIASLARRDDVIMTYRVDRLSRNIFLSLEFLENLRERGVLVYVPEFGDETSGLWYHEQRLLFIQSLLDATKEAELIGKRVKAATDYRVKRGDEAIGSVPYGFSLERELIPGATRVVDGEVQPVTKCLRVTVNDAEAKIIDEIVQRRGTLVCTEQAQIFADTLNIRGLRKRGRKWSAKMVSTLAVERGSRWREENRPVPPQNRVNKKQRSA